MQPSDIQWPPSDDEEKERLISFILDELDRIDLAEPMASEGTGLMLRLVDAWDRRDARQPDPAAPAPRKRGRPRIDPLDRLPGLAEFIAIDAERVRALFRKHWRRSNYTQPYIPSVAEVVIRRWQSTAQEHGIQLTVEAVGRLTSAMDKLRAAAPEVRMAVLEILDEMSQPMHPREIEKASCRNGFTRSEARPIVNVLKHLPIVAIGAGNP